MFSILNEIKNNSHHRSVHKILISDSFPYLCCPRTTSVIVASIGSAASVYVLVAVTGYLSFGNAVLGNIVGMCKSPAQNYSGRY
jgi:amino acid permease